MSKKLLSLVLAIAMVMSLFTVAFTTTAAADETEATQAATLTYYFLAPDAYGAPNAYWWTPTEAAGWPGTAMKAVPELGKNVYAIDAPAETSVIIFNGNGTQTINIDITKETTGKNNVGNMIFVITGNDGNDTGEWCSLNPADADYYRNSAGYAVENDTPAQFYPLYDEAPVAGDKYVPTELTYYVYAPAALGTSFNAYWWLPTEAAGWPGTAMTAAPEVGPEIYKISAPLMTTVIIFNNGNGYQTANLDITEEGTGFSNVANKIFIITGLDGENHAIGEWKSLDPRDADFYAGAPVETSDTADTATTDTAETDDTPAPAAPAFVPAVPRWDAGIVCGLEEEEEPTVSEGFLYFKADKEPFTTDDKQIVYFHLWGGATDYGWGSKKEKATYDEEKGLWAYPVDFGDATEMFMIVYIYGGGATKVQSFDTIINKKAIDNIVIIEDELLENPVDSSQTAYAAFVVDADGNKIKGCGPVATIASTAKVVGTIKAKDTDYADQLAEKILTNYKDAENWTKESVKAIEEELGLDNSDVKAKVEAKIADRNGDEKDDNDIPEEDIDTIMALLEDDAEESPDVPPVDTPDTPDTPDSPDVPVDTDTETPVETDTETPVETDTETPVETDTETPVETDTDKPPVETDTDEPPVDDVKPGDVDKDGAVTSADALAILRASLDPDALTPEQVKVMDIDGDGAVTSNDAIIALRYSAGIEGSDTQKLIDIFGKVS